MQQIQVDILQTELIQGYLKTYVTDPIGKKVMKNLGGQPMHYVENNHPAIIPKEIFNRAKEETARRASKRKIMQKRGKTEQGKYSDRYALSPLLRHQADHSISFSGQLFHPLVFPEPQKGGQTLKNLVGLDHKHHCLYRPLPPEGRHKG